MAEELFLDVSVVLETPLGDLELEDPLNGYWLHKESFGTRAYGTRQIKVDGDWTPGTDVIRSTDANVTEALVVFVKGATHYEMETRIEALRQAYKQLSYTVTRTVGDSQEVWQCRAVESFSVETEQEFQHATLAIVRAQVPRLPDVVRTQVVVGP